MVVWTFVFIADLAMVVKSYSLGHQPVERKHLWRNRLPRTSPTITSTHAPVRHQIQTQTSSEVCLQDRPLCCSPEIDAHNTAAVCRCSCVMISWYPVITCVNNWAPNEHASSQCFLSWLPRLLMREESQAHWRHWSGSVPAEGNCWDHCVNLIFLPLSLCPQRQCPHRKIHRQKTDYIIVCLYHVYIYIWLYQEE